MDISEDSLPVDTANPFINHEILHILEQTNPCDQTYQFSEKPFEISFVVSYHFGLNIFTYLGLNLKYHSQIIGIPCSVAYSGYTSPMTGKTRQTLLDRKGLKVILNSSEKTIPGFSSGHTLPTCTLTNRWETIEGYISQLRSHYRYRLIKAQDKWKDVETIRLTDNQDFSLGMYQMYLDVYNKSEFKLEKLSLSFFREFPGDIYQFHAGKIPLGFVQVHEESRRLIFMFAGMNYTYLKVYDIYYNLLLWIIQLGISRRCEKVDLGQTGEEMKLKLGCVLEKKYLHLHHSNKLLNRLIKIAMPLASYKVPSYNFNVFRTS